MDLSQTNGLDTYVVLQTANWLGRTPMTTILDACGPVERIELRVRRPAWVNPLVYRQRVVFDWLVEQGIPHHFTVVEEDLPDTKSDVNWFVCLLCVDPKYTALLRIKFGVLPIRLSHGVPSEVWDPQV